jgi:hypothetical protein
MRCIEKCHPHKSKGGKRSGRCRTYSLVERVERRQVEHLLPKWLREGKKPPRATKKGKGTKGKGKGKKGGVTVAAAAKKKTAAKKKPAAKK